MIYYDKLISLDQLILGNHWSATFLLIKFLMLKKLDQKNTWSADQIKWINKVMTLNEVYILYHYKS